MTTAPAAAQDRFPTINSVFIRPSLLEAKAPAEALGGVIGVKDAERLAGLNGRKGKKLARLWAPLIYHNLFHGLHADAWDDKLVQELTRAEEVLNTTSATSWREAFQEAGEAGVAPSSLIFKLPVGKKRLLTQHRDAWKTAGEGIESILSGWILRSSAEIKAAYQSLPSSEFTLSLKKVGRIMI